MPYQYDYAPSVDYEVDDQKRSEVARLYKTEADAVFALYEQLFCNRNAICKETVLHAMQYLVFCKDLDEQWEEIQHMRPEDVDAVHHREMEKSVEETTKEFKDKLYNILEDKLF